MSRFTSIICGCVVFAAASAGAAPVAASTFEGFLKKAGDVLDDSHSRYVKDQNNPELPQWKRDQRDRERLAAEKEAIGELWQEHKAQVAQNDAIHMGSLAIISPAFTLANGYYDFNPHFGVDAGLGVRVRYDLLDLVSETPVFDPRISTVAFSIRYGGEGAFTNLGLADYGVDGAGLDIHLYGYEPTILAIPLDASGQQLIYPRADGDDTGAAATFGMGNIGAAVPEPSTWTLLLASFGAVGIALRLRRPRGASSRTSAAITVRVSA